MRNARARTGIAIDLVLVEDVHPRVERREEDRRIDVALMVRSSTRRRDRAAGARVPATRYRMPAEREPQPDAAVAEDIEQVRPAEDRGQQHADQAGDEDVEGDGDVGRDGSDGGDEHWRPIINENARQARGLVDAIADF